MNIQLLQLTKLDGAPIWITADKIAAITPGSEGSHIYFTGDANAFVVRETTDEILRQLAAPFSSSMSHYS